MFKTKTFKTKTAKTRTASTKLSDQELQQVSGGYALPTTANTAPPPLFSWRTPVYDGEISAARSTGVVSPVTFKP
jgi:bacteriocin-like protein